MYLPPHIVYTWGTITHKGATLYKQAQPYQQPIGNISSIACGWSHAVAVDSYGDVFVMGSNEAGQLGLQGELHSKQFKRLQHAYLGPARTVFCVNDATFLVNRDEEVLFCGRISHNRKSVSMQVSPSKS